MSPYDYIDPGLAVIIGALLTITYLIVARVQNSREDHRG